MKIHLLKLKDPWKRHQIHGDGYVTYCAVNWDTGEIQVEAGAKLRGGGEVVPAEQIPEDQKQRAIKSIVLWMRGDDPDWGPQHKL